MPPGAPAYDVNNMMGDVPQGMPVMPDPQTQGTTSAAGAEESFEERLRRLKDL